MEENQKPEVKSQFVKFSTGDISSTEKAKKKTPIVILIILAVVLFVPVAVIAYLIATGQLDFFNKVVDGEQEETLKESVTENEEGNASNDFADWKIWTGEYISAKLPAGWSIIETVNNKGAYGITQIAIVDEAQKVVFTLDAISDVDTSECSCTEYYTFTDTDPNEFNDFKSSQGENCSITNVPLTDSYIEFLMLGKRVRRIGLSYYVDTKMGDQYFGGSSNCVGFTSISMVDSDTGKHLGYKHDLSNEIVPFNLYSMRLLADGLDATLVDKILTTFHIVNEYDWDSEETSQSERKTYDQMNLTERQQFIVDMMMELKASIQNGNIFLQNPVTHLSYVSTGSASGMLTGYVMAHSEGSSKDDDFNQVVNALLTKGYSVVGLSVDSPNLKYQTLTYFDSVCAVSRRWSDFPLNKQNGNIYDMYVFCGVGDIAAVDSADAEKVLSIIDDLTMIDFNGIKSSVTVATKNINDLEVFLSGKSLVPRTPSTKTTDDDLLFIDEVFKTLGYWYIPATRNVGYFRQTSIGDTENRYYFDNKETYCKVSWVDNDYRPLTIYCGTVD